MTYLLNRRSVLSACAAAVLPTLSTSSVAQLKWPTKPIRIVVPFAAGLSVDVVLRLIAEQLQTVLGQPVLIDNKPGAAGIIGTEIVAKSPADGYTLLYSVTSVMSMNPHFYSRQPYDTLKDFVPVIKTTNVQFVLVTAPQQPYRTLQELLAAAKAKPGSIDYGSTGVGSAQHILTEMLNNMAGVRLVHIPYKAAFLPDVVGAQIHIAFDPTTTSIPMVRAGKLRALGVTSKVRNPALPDVPTIAEVLPGFEGDNWHGFFAPAGTPQDIVARLNAEIGKIMRTPQILSRLLDLGLQPVSGTPEEFAKEVKTDFDKWGEVARKNNIRID